MWRGKDKRTQKGTGCFNLIFAEKGAVFGAFFAVRKYRDFSVRRACNEKKGKSIVDFFAADTV